MNAIKVDGAIIPAHRADAAGIKPREHVADGAAGKQAVRIHEHKDLAPRVRDAGVKSRALTLILLVNKPDGVVLRGQSLHDYGRAIGGAIVNQDYFKVGVITIHDGMHTVFQHVFLVVPRDNHTHQGIRICQ